MNVMAPTRPTELCGRRVRLTAGPAAAGEARRQVRAAISAWEIPVDPDVVALLTSELVTNAITHEANPDHHARHHVLLPASCASMSTTHRAPCRDR